MVNLMKEKLVKKNEAQTLETFNFDIWYDLS